MWLFTKYGFYSVVVAKKMQDGRLTRDLDPDLFMVRARVRSHLENLAKQFPPLRDISIAENAGTDYRFRIFVPRTVWVQVVADLTTAIDYDNFKGACEDSRSVDDHYTQALHEIWEIHNLLQRRR